MKEYRLVASYYNRQKKQYENEIEIGLEEYNLKTLVEIDKFTSNKTHYELEKMAREKCNSLSNPIFKVRTFIDEKAIYMDAFIDNNIIKDATNNIEIKNFYKNNRKIPIPCVSLNCKSFNTEKNKIIDIIIKKDREKLNSIYPNNNQFKFIIERHLNSSFDNPSDEEKSIADIILEFSKYINFRTFISKQRRIEFTHVKPRKLQGNYIIDKKKTNETKKILSVNDSIEKKDYKKEIIHSLMADYEKEEFLDEKELEIMGYTL